MLNAMLDTSETLFPMHHNLCVIQLGGVLQGLRQACMSPLLISDKLSEPFVISTENIR
jgi:hypothetical protein